MYINLTNKCSNGCEFCVRNERASYYGNYLWIRHGDPTAEKVIAELEKKFAGEGRVLIRPSGTEPLVRVMIEGKNQQEIQQEAEKLAELIQGVMF